VLSDPLHIHTDCPENQRRPAFSFPAKRAARLRSTASRRAGSTTTRAKAIRRSRERSPLSGADLISAVSAGKLRDRMSRGRTFLRVFAGGWLALQLAAAIGASIAMGVGGCSDACWPSLVDLLPRSRTRADLSDAPHARSGPHLHDAEHLRRAGRRPPLALFCSRSGVAGPGSRMRQTTSLSALCRLTFALVVRTELPESPPPRS